MTSRYFASLDVGQAQDYSALCVLEAQGFGSTSVCSVRHLQRWPLGTSYPAICSDTAALLKREPLLDAPLILDATGCGRPIADLLRQSIPASRLHAVTITSGTTETKDEVDRVTYWNVPKRMYPFTG